MGRQTAAQRSRRAGGRHWTPAKARRELAAWKASGLSIPAFERQQGLKPTRLRWWQRRLGDWADGEAPTHAPAFIPALMHEAAGTASTSAPVTVRLPGGVVVEVADPASVPSKWLTAVVSGLSRVG